MFQHLTGATESVTYSGVT